MHPFLHAATRGVLLVTAWACLSGVDAAAADKTARKILSGTLERIAPKTSKLLKLRWHRSTLRADWKYDVESLDELFDDIADASGSNGSGSSHGGREFSTSFDGQTLDGRMETFKPLLGKPSIRVVFDEKDGPARTVEFYDDGAGKLTLGIRSLESKYLLQIHQAYNGSVRVQEVRGLDVFSRPAKSMYELIHQHPEFAEKNLLPALRRVGISLPPSMASPEVRAVVLSMLTPPPEKEHAAFAPLLAELDDESYKIRSAANKKIADAFNRFKPSILQTLGANEISAETKTRLKEMVAKQGSPVDRFVTENRLAHDGPSLVWLLAASEEDTAKKAVVARLESTSGKAFGDDLAAWKTWAAAQHDTPADIAVIDPLKDTGTITKVAPKMRTMVRLVVKDGRLQLDRNHWKKTFGGKSIKQLNNEIEDELEKRGFPRDWYQDHHWRHGNNGEVTHTEVLFQHLANAAGGHGNGSSWRRSGRERNASSDDFDAKLELEPGATKRSVLGDIFGTAKQRQNLSAGPFKIRIREKKRGPTNAASERRWQRHCGDFALQRTDRLTCCGSSAIQKEQSPSRNCAAAKPSLPRPRRSLRSSPSIPNLSANR